MTDQNLADHIGQPEGQFEAAAMKSETPLPLPETPLPASETFRPASETPLPAPEPPFDTFVFDLDGTLLNTLPDLVVITNEALRRMGFPERTSDEILSFVGNGVRALMYQAVPAGTPAAEADKALALWKEINLASPNDLTAPYSHMVETLQALKARGCRLGVLSNKFDGGVKQIINQYLPGIFDIMHGECDEIPRKPDPAGLERTLRELGAEPARCVYIGDSPNDIVTARRAGTYGVAVTWGYHTVDHFAQRDAEPDLFINDPRELLEIAQSDKEDAQKE